MKPVTQHRRRTWPARKITAGMHAHGVTHVSLAAQLGCSRSNVSQVVGGLTKSWAVARAIAAVIGLQPWDIWPRIYAAPALGPAMSTDAPMTAPTAGPTALAS